MLLGKKSNESLTFLWQQIKILIYILQFTLNNSNIDGCKGEKIKDILLICITVVGLHFWAIIFYYCIRILQYF